MLFEFIAGDFKRYLQSDVTIMVGNKVYRRGKFILYNSVNNTIEVLLNVVDQQCRVQIPLPFQMEAHHPERIIYFDYRIQHIVDRNDATSQLIDALAKKMKPHRFYNQIVAFEFND